MSARPLPLLLVLAALAFTVFVGYLPARRESSLRQRWEAHTREEFRQQVQSWLRWVAATARKPEAEGSALLSVTPLVQPSADSAQLMASQQPEGYGRDWILAGRRFAGHTDTLHLVRARELYDLAINLAAPPCRKIGLFEGASISRRLGRLTDALLLDAQLLAEFGDQLAVLDRCRVLQRRVDSLVSSNELWSASEICLELRETLLPLDGEVAAELERKAAQRLRTWARAETPPFPELPELVASLELRAALHSLAKTAPDFRSEPCGLPFEHAGRSLIAVLYTERSQPFAAVLERSPFPLELTPSGLGDGPALSISDWALGALLPVYAAVFLYFLHTRRERKRRARLLAFARRLKTPVARLHALGETLEAPGLRPEQVEAYVRAIRREAEQLARPIANVLELAHFEDERKPYTFEAVEPGALLDEVAYSAEALENRALEIALPEQLPRVSGEGRALALALANLFDLLLDHSTGALTLRGSPRGDRVELRLEAEHVDLPRLRGALRDEALGLSVARRVLAAHRGRLAWELSAERTVCQVSLVRMRGEPGGEALQVEPRSVSENS